MVRSYPLPGNMDPKLKKLIKLNHIRLLAAENRSVWVFISVFIILSLIFGVISKPACIISLAILWMIRFALKRVEIPYKDGYVCERGYYKRFK